ncbi:MAG: hypothetical protein MUO82_05095 [Candidatus Thermoplasmatota archaeon]|nr:hypothetical protein [Candidatus Thermoplasmatota archaeon]
MTPGIVFCLQGENVLFCYSSSVLNCTVAPMTPAQLPAYCPPSAWNDSSVIISCAMYWPVDRLALLICSL